MRDYECNGCAGQPMYPESCYYSYSSGCCEQKRPSCGGSCGGKSCVICGATGPTGATGATGSTGATGATGIVPPAATATNMSAQNTSGGIIAITPGGTLVPLTSNQVLSNFTASADGTTFTALSAGTYLISYSVNVTAAPLMTSQILKNGAPLVGSAVSTLLTAAGSLSNSLIAPLVAGDTVSLQLSGLAANVTLQGGTGAYLNIIKLA